MKNKLLVGVCVFGLSVQLLGKPFFVNAAEVIDISGKNVQIQKAVNGEFEPESISDEDQYPDWWDAEDPLNARAYRQMTEESGNLMDTSLALKATGVTTQWNGVTYTHCANNTEGKNIVAGIDVSYHQGTIDWKKVKNAGIDYVIIRVGYRAYRSGSLGKDVKFLSYIKGAKEAGLQVGAYIFSQAITEEEAVEEADFAIKQIEASGYTLDLPLAIDCEYAAEGVGRLYEAHLSKKEMTDVANAFCERVQSLGYQPMIYSSSSWFYNKMDGETLAQKYLLWMARYNTHSYDASTESDKALYGGQIGIWQCSSSAKVDGISGNVDLDWFYLDTLNGVCQGEDGNWYYYVNGEIDETFSGLAKNQNGWWYVRNGKVDFSYYGVEQNGNGWWRIEDGKVNFDFNGFAENRNGWWYLENGKVQLDRTDVIQGTVDGKNGWWYVENGKVVFTETIAENRNGWWYINGGAVDFEHYGVEQNRNGWWKIEAGKVNFEFSGFAENRNGWWYLEAGKVQLDVNDVIQGTVDKENGWWYVKNGKVTVTESEEQNRNAWWKIEAGKVNLEFNGFAENRNGWWYLEDGKVQFGVTDVLRGTVNDENGWWRIEAGKVNFEFDGFAENRNGWWYLEGGKVQLDRTDVIQGVVDGENGWWYVEGGKVTDTNTVAQNRNGWWYIENGKVDFDHYGVEQNRNGWWRIEAGEVNFSFNGFAENRNGWWYLEGGKVQLDRTDVIQGVIDGSEAEWYVKEGQIQLDFSGMISVNGKSYMIENGRVK